MNYVLLFLLMPLFCLLVLTASLWLVLGDPAGLALLLVVGFVLFQRRKARHV